MIDYDVRGHFPRNAVADRSDRQVRMPRNAVADRSDRQVRSIGRFGDLRLQLIGHFEEQAFRSLLTRVRPGGFVLDVGGGAGRYARRLWDAGYRVVGTDAVVMLGVARDRPPRRPGLVATEPSDAVRLPYGKGAFDGVTCMRPYHQVPLETRLQMLREVRRVARCWAILVFAMSSRVVRPADGGRPESQPLTMGQLDHDLDAAGLQIQERRWVLPGLSDGLLVLATRRR